MSGSILRRGIAASGLALALFLGFTQTAEAQTQTTGSCIVNYAESQLGAEYVYGGEWAGHDFDCSGLTQWSYSKVGKRIPRTADEQWNASTDVWSNPRPGDIVFFMDSYSYRYGHAFHVGIYLGNGRMVDANAGSYNRVVNESIYWWHGKIRFGRF